MPVGRFSYWPVISVTGVVFLALHIVHIFLMGDPIVILVVDGLPVVLTLALVYTGYRFHRSKWPDSRGTRVVKWFFAGILFFVLVSLLSVEVHTVVHGHPVRHSFIIHTNVGIAGGSAGLLVGVYDAQRRAHFEEVEAQRRKLDEFAAIVSHDLRNPLNVVEGSVRYARVNDEPVPFDRIERSLERMRHLIDDLLALARAGETISSPRSIEIGSAATAGWETVETAGASLRVETERVVVADEARLQQLFENLFRNAIEHGGDAVTVVVGEGEDGFYVEDDGPGIPESERGSIFESGYTTAPDGSGLGLSIVEQIAEAHGWRVDVTDGSNGGSRFEFTGVRFAPG